jgi:hypothetical protein
VNFHQITFKIFIDNFFPHSTSTKEKTFSYVNVWTIILLTVLLVFINSAEKIHQKRAENFLAQHFLVAPKCFIFKSSFHQSTEKMLYENVSFSAHIITIVFLLEIIKKKFERHEGKWGKKSFMIYRNFIDFSR